MSKQRGSLESSSALGVAIETMDIIVGEGVGSICLGRRHADGLVTECLTFANILGGSLGWVGRRIQPAEKDNTN